MLQGVILGVEAGGQLLLGQLDVLRVVALEHAHGRQPGIVPPFVERGGVVRHLAGRQQMAHRGDQRLRAVVGTGGGHDLAQRRETGIGQQALLVAAGILRHVVAVMHVGREVRVFAGIAQHADG